MFIWCFSSLTIPINYYTDLFVSKYSILSNKNLEIPREQMCCKVKKELILFYCPGQKFNVNISASLYLSHRVGT